jgi:hypothetical protein
MPSGLPARFTIAPGRWGWRGAVAPAGPREPPERPQARGRIEGLTGAGHVVMDAA